MPYTFKSVTAIWLVAFGLLALTVSGVVEGPWLILPLMVALTSPALILQSVLRGFTTSRERPAVLANAPARFTVRPQRDRRQSV